MSNDVGTIRILHVEDDAADAEFIRRELESGGLSLDVTQARSATEFDLAYSACRFDLILAEYSLSSFDGLAALKAVRQTDSDLPFIFVSSAFGEDVFVDGARFGATDFVAKTQLSRLPMVVRRALLHGQERIRRRQSERVTREMIERKSAIFDSFSTPIALLDDSGVIVASNDSWRKFASLNAALLPNYGIGENFLEQSSCDCTARQESVSRAIDGIRRVLANETDAFSLDYVCEVEEEQRWFQLVATPVDPRERSGAVVTQIDATERRLAEEALRASEARFELVVKGSNDGIWDRDIVTGETYHSPRLKEMLGYGGVEGNAVAIVLETLIHDDDREKAVSALKTHFADRSPLNVECRFQTLSGGYRWCNLRGQASWDALGNAVRIAGSLTDITERKSLEAQFRQSQKIEAFGQLAGGVAHDFNNFITVIHGNADIVLSSGALTEEAEECCKEIVAASIRAADLTRQLLAFSRHQVMRFQDTEINDVVSGMARMLTRIIGEHIALRCDLTPKQTPVHADSSMIEQVVMNLVVNARDAMPKGGRIFIQTEVVTIDAEAAAKERDASVGEFVRLGVRDTGVGMSPEILSRMFEPFFTTKEVGRGTGIGLATVYGIVKQHGGWVGVSSRVNEGTAFEVYLPTNRDVQSAVSLQPAQPEVRRGHETILLVEDEQALCHLTHLVLERQGYRVFDASSGVEALEVWNQHPTDIDLVLSDVTMPDGLTGWDLVARLRTDRPWLKVILTSGYSCEFPDDGHCQAQNVRFMQKPYSPKKLISAIRDYLDGKPESES